MQQSMVLELPDDIYEAIKQAALAGGLQPAEWVMNNLRQQLRPGSPLAILQAMQKAPRLSSEDVDALEQAIKEGEIPIDWTPIFPEHEDDDEQP